MLTSLARSAPTISGAERTRSASTVGEAPAYSGPLKMPARMAPRSRRWRVRARVSMPLMPTTPWSRSSSSSGLVDRQFEGRSAGSRTT